MQELVSYIVKQLVENPDQVSIEEIEENGTIQMTLKVAESDKGKVIGKQGKVIEAIRALLSVSSQKADKKVNLEIA